MMMITMRVIHDGLLDDHLTGMIDMSGDPDRLMATLHGDVNPFAAKVLSRRDILSIEI
jgi:hypothetical protein